MTPFLIDSNFPLLLRQEEQRKLERKNRDEFRKLMEEHVSSGILTASTNWRDYSVKVWLWFSWFLRTCI